MIKRVSESPLSTFARDNVFVERDAEKRELLLSTKNFSTEMNFVISFAILFSTTATLNENSIREFLLVLDRAVVFRGNDHSYLRSTRQIGRMENRIKSQIRKVWRGLTWNRKGKRLVSHRTDLFSRCKNVVGTIEESYICVVLEKFKRTWNSKRSTS